MSISRILGGCTNSKLKAEERLPIAEGWTRSTSSINGFSLNLLVAKLAWATKSSVEGAKREKEL